MERESFSLCLKLDLLVFTYYCPHLQLESECRVEENSDVTDRANFKISSWLKFMCQLF